MPDNTTYLFVVDWWDPQPQLVRKYLLKYFVEQHALEMVDLKSHKLFLKKSNAAPELSESDFRVGNKVLIYGRQLTISDYGDGTTRKALEVDITPALVLLPSAAVKDWGIYVHRMVQSGLTVRRVRTVYLSGQDAAEVCARVGTTSGSELSSSVALSCYLEGADATNIATNVCASIVAEHGCAPAVCAVGPQEAQDGAAFIAQQPSTATLDCCTCAIVLPHAVRSGNFGEILDTVLSQGYEVSCIDTMSFSQPSAKEYLEVYKDVVPDFTEHVTALCSGPVVALELRAEDAVQTFRQTAGPWDVQMAKELRPESLRAKFGQDNIRCGVRCTDLPTDGVSECEYVFKILS
jgi:nucleoside-diphosphate kinase